MAAEGINSGFAEDDREAGHRGYPEEAVVLAGSGSQAAPGRNGGATQLGAHRKGSGISQEEHRVGPGIGVKSFGLNQGFKQCRGEFSFLDQVMLNPWPVAGHGRGQDQGTSLGRGLGRQ